MPFKLSLSSNQHVSAFLFSTWVLHATHILSHMDIDRDKIWEWLKIIKPQLHTILQPLLASSPLRPVFSFCEGFFCPSIFMLSLFSLPLCCYLMLIRDRKKICNKMYDLIHCTVVSTQIYIPLPGRVNRPKTLQNL